MARRPGIVRPRTNARQGRAAVEGQSGAGIWDPEGGAERWGRSVFSGKGWSDSGPVGPTRPRGHSCRTPPVRITGGGAEGEGVQLWVFLGPVLGLWCWGREMRARSTGPRCRLAVL